MMSNFNAVKIHIGSMTYPLEFKAQIADPEFEGFCHCMLYYKEK